MIKKYSPHEKAQAIVIMAVVIVGLIALMALVIPLVIHTQTEYPLYHSLLHWLVLLVLVFYIDSESQSPQHKP